MAKPSSKPEWTVGNVDFGTITVEPTATKKEAGWLPDERPPREYMNWLFFNINEWIDYLEGVTDVFATQGNIYDAFIGGGGTHADVNAWQADPDIANLKNALVISTIAIDVPQVIDNDGCNLDFKANAGFTKNGPTGSDFGIQVDANRIRINNGRFIGFNDVGVDKAIILNGNNCLVHGCMFNDCDTVIEDNGNGNVIGTNIEEV